VSPNETTVSSGRRHGRRSIVSSGTTVPEAVGAPSSISVDDTRGSLVGWRSTVFLQTVSGLDAAQLASTRLCVTPHPTTFVAGNPADRAQYATRVRRPG
jgi:hypothetical protein